MKCLQLYLGLPEQIIQFNQIFFKWGGEKKTPKHTQTSYLNVTSYTSHFVSSTLTPA